MKALFLLRTNGSYNTTTSKSGLLNSSRMTAEALQKYLWVDTKLVVIIDSNSIDREIHKFKPDVVFLEAIWITPEKMRELTRLHPKIKFVIRVHSETPFLSNEGEAISRIKHLERIHNVHIAFNSRTTTNDFIRTEVDKDAEYLPNIYDIDYTPTRITTFTAKLLKLLGLKKSEFRKNTINVGCFGAIRPMKNQLIQAMAAIELANKLDIKLYFHINFSRLEQGGESVYKNMKALFEGTKHELVEHGWLDRENFLLLISQMDIGMQVSFNESFNIVTADFVKQDIPILVSPSINWMPLQATADPENQEEMVQKLLIILRHMNYFRRVNKRSLIQYNNIALRIWRNYLKYIK